MCRKLQSLFEGFENETSHWQFLNVFFKPTVTRFFICWFALAPAVVKAIQGLPSPLIITVGKSTYPIALELPFSWEVLWWASLIYAIAFVLHLLFCPDFIKRYPSYNEYTSRGHSPRWLVWEVFRAWGAIPKRAREKLFQRLSSKNYATTEVTELPLYAQPTVSKNGTEWAFEYLDKIYVLRINESLSSERQRDLFWEIFGRHGGSRSVLRYLVWGLLLISAILVLRVVYENIVFVLAYLL